MNPLLVREVQPPLIYDGGDGRLKKHTIEQSIYNFFHLRFVSYPRIFFLVLRRSSLESCESRGPRGERIDLGQPIAAVLPDGILPGSVGLRVFKSILRLSCVSRCR